MCNGSGMGLDKPTASCTDIPSHGSWSGEGCRPSAPWFSHWSPCRTARWGFLSGWGKMVGGWGGGEEREINMVEDCFKMYELLKKFSKASLMSQCAARIQMPVLLSVNQSIRNLQRSDCIHTWAAQRAAMWHCTLIYMCVYIWWVSVCLCWYFAGDIFYTSHWDVHVCTQPLCCFRQSVYVCVCVCHSSYDWMHVGAQSQRNPVMNELPFSSSCEANQSESKMDGWH